MMNIFIEAVDNELDSGWYTAFFFLIGFIVVSFLVIIIYLYSMKNNIRYYINGVLIYTQKYRKNEKIRLYKYNDVDKWYVDEDCTVLFEEGKMPKRDIKLHAFDKLYDHK